MERKSRYEATRQAATRISPVPALVLVGVVLAVGYLTVLDPDALFDLRADRLTALAALKGLNPYEPVADLAARYGSTLGWTHVHPRTPGALILQLPLVLVDETSLVYVSALGTAFALVAIFAISLRVVSAPPIVAVLAALAAGVSSVAVESAVVGSQSPLVALLLTWAWWRLRSEDDALGGIALGLAITLKLFPWVIVASLVLHRRKAAAAAVIATSILTLGGLGLPGVDLGDAARAVSSANLSQSAELNSSASRFVGELIDIEALTLMMAGVVLAVGIFVGVRVPDHDRGWHAMTAFALAASPLIWRHYMLALIPALLWLAGRSRCGLTMAALGAAWFVAPWPQAVVWFAVPLCLVVAAAVLSHSPQHEAPNR